MTKDLRKVIAGAISDPGATQGYKGERTLTEWQTDAVLAALSGSPQVEAGTVEKGAPPVPTVKQIAALTFIVDDYEGICEEDVRPYASDYSSVIADARAAITAITPAGTVFATLGRSEKYSFNQEPPTRPREQEGGKAPVEAGMLDALQHIRAIYSTDTDAYRIANHALRRLYAHPPLPADGWKEGIEAAVKVADRFEKVADDEGEPSAAMIAGQIADALRALLPTPPASTEGGAAPYMTDMMVSPESLDAFMKANPLPKLTPKRRTMLERIARNSPLLELNILASGGSADRILSDLRNAGYVQRVEHPTVKRGGYPADAFEITKAGRAALAGEPPP